MAKKHFYISQGLPDAENKNPMRRDWIDWLRWCRLAGWVRSAHWRGWEPGNCSVLKAGCLSNPDVMLEAFRITKEYLVFCSHWTGKRLGSDVSKEWQQEARCIHQPKVREVSKGTLLFSLHVSVSGWLMEGSSQYRKGLPYSVLSWPFLERQSHAHKHVS